MIAKCEYKTYKSIFNFMQEPLTSARLSWELGFKKPRPLLLIIWSVLPLSASKIGLIRSVTFGLKIVLTKKIKNVICPHFLFFFPVCVGKILIQMISTSKWHAKHLFASQNTQHIGPFARRSLLGETESSYICQLHLVSWAILS